MLQTPRGHAVRWWRPTTWRHRRVWPFLRDGGNAVEAMVAAASTVAVVYPHMNSIGETIFG